MMSVNLFVLGVLQELAEKVGTGVNERDRVLMTLHFKDIAKITWDHQNSTCKLDIRGLVS
jgi:hypothetical protein